MLGLISKLAFIRRKVGEDCKNCSLCDQTLPNRHDRPGGKGYASDPSECTLCPGMPGTFARRSSII